MSYVPENVDRFSGFAEAYDRHRPTPPAALVDVLTRYARTDTPSLVVDLGCGTGLSTRLWAGRADRVVGIEPNEDMLQLARARTTAPGIAYRAGHAAETGLEDASADIVTACQALHWMEPRPTLAEIARILRPGGVFAAVDCDWPPVVEPEVEAAYSLCLQQARMLAERRGWDRIRRAWHKHEHLARLEASGHFRYVRELVLHTAEPGDAERLVGLAATETAVAGALRRGVSEDGLGLTRLRAVAERILGPGRQTWYFAYRVRVGVT